VWVGNASGRTTTVATSSFGSTINTGSFATTGSNAFFGNNSFSGTFAVSSSAISILSGSTSGSVITNLTDTYTSVPAVNQIVTLPSASYAALLSGSLVDSNTLYIISGSTELPAFTALNAFTASQLTINSGYNTFTASQQALNTTFATTGSNSFNGNQTISGSLILSSSADVELTVIGNTVISGSLILSSSAAVELTVIGNMVVTGSAFGNVVPLSISSNTASMDLSRGNYFTLTLSGSTTHITATNVQPGVSATLLITTGTNTSASLAPILLQPSGSTYVASNGSSKKDVLSIVALDSTN
jgi:hypothetical protein